MLSVVRMKLKVVIQVVICLQLVVITTANVVFTNSRWQHLDKTWNSVKSEQANEGNCVTKIKSVHDS